MAVLAEVLVPGARDYIKGFIEQSEKTQLPLLGKRECRYRQVLKSKGQRPDAMIEFDSQEDVIIIRFFRRRGSPSPEHNFWEEGFRMPLNFDDGGNLVGFREITARPRIRGVVHSLTYQVVPESPHVGKLTVCTTWRTDNKGFPQGVTLSPEDIEELLPRLEKAGCTQMVNLTDTFLSLMTGELHLGGSATGKPITAEVLAKRLLIPAA